MAFVSANLINAMPGPDLNQLMVFSVDFYVPFPSLHLTSHVHDRFLTLLLGPSDPSCFLK
jgi:hypothetical protein